MGRVLYLLASLLGIYREIWLVDFEFDAPPGEQPTPRCLVALELRSGRLLRIWEDELLNLPRPPYDTGPQSLFVAFFASAELGCHAALGWPMPERILDLYVEFRCITNGMPLPAGRGLIGALTWFGLDALTAAEKEGMRQLVLRGEPYTVEEISAVLDYCESDVRALERLIPMMLPRIDLPRALLRGRYMTAVARMEHYGIPIDMPALTALQSNWEGIKESLITRIDADYGVFEGTTFKTDRWATWLAAEGIPWPRLPSGALDLKMETFRQQARSHPRVAPIHELRRALSRLKLSALTVGADGRNRCLLSPFSTKTGRNAPSTSKFIYGPSAWLRGLIRPEPGIGLAILDYAQQEFAIAAALSGDEAMLKAYTLGDPYMAFAILAGAAPQGAIKATHGGVRALFKACVLAVQYLMGPESLAMRIGKQPAHARDLLRRHRETFPRFWQWSEAAVNRAMLLGKINTTFGWTLHVGQNPNPRSLANFPMQANGAEMLRLACCLATERGVRVVAPVHDALVIEAPLELLDEAIITTQESMKEASRVVLDGFDLRTDLKVVRYPDIYMDGRGARMWKTVWGLIPGGDKP